MEEEFINKILEIVYGNFSQNGYFTINDFQKVSRFKWNKYFISKILDLLALYGYFEVRRINKIKFYFLRKEKKKGV